MRRITWNNNTSHFCEFAIILELDCAETVLFIRIKSDIFAIHSTVNCLM